MGFKYQAVQVSYGYLPVNFTPLLIQLWASFHFLFIFFKFSVICSDRLELSFAVNVAGTYTMTELLMPLLEKASPDARVITVSSGGMYNSPLTKDLQVIFGLICSFLKYNNFFSSRSRCEQIQICCLNLIILLPMISFSMYIGVSSLTSFGFLVKIWKLAGHEMWDLNFGFPMKEISFASHVPFLSFVFQFLGLGWEGRGWAVIPVIIQIYRMDLFYHCSLVKATLMVHYNMLETRDSRLVWNIRASPRVIAF